MTDDDEAARKDRLAHAQKLIDLFTPIETTLIMSDTRHAPNELAASRK